MAKKVFEDQLLTFSNEDLLHEDVLCDLETDEENWKEITLKTKDTRIITLNSTSEVTVRFYSKNISGDLIKTTELKDAYINDFKDTHNGNNRKFSLSLHPRNVMIYMKDSSAKASDGAHVIFYINDAPMLSPRVSSKPDIDGNLSQKKSPPINILLNKRKTVTSDVAFKYSLKGKKFQSEYYQILKLNIRKKKNIIESIENYYLPKIDEILYLSSLTHDAKTSCHSWSASFQNQRVICYRGNQFASENIENTRMSETIDRKDVGEFISTALKKFTSSPYKSGIRNAIASLMLNRNTVIELTFLAYFQAIESLILTHRRLRGVELAVNKSRFRKVRSEISSFIRDMNSIDEKTKERFNSKLPELNRISLKEAALSFFEEFSISTDGVWPIFDNKNGITLSDLRNTLIHGDLIPSEQFQNLVIAHENLRALLIRIVFNVLGWPTIRTNLTDDILKTRQYSLHQDIIIKSQSEITLKLEEK